MTSKATFERNYMRAQEFAAHRPLVVVGLFAVAWLIACVGLASLRLDLSFRPLFASGADIAAPTEEFEQVFGQSSGAWIVAILENDGMTAAHFVQEAARLSDRVGEIAGVTEVVSLTHLRLPTWGPQGLSVWSPIPEPLLEPYAGDALESRYALLQDGTQFSGWLVSEDGRRLLLGARLGVPMGDLDARREIVAEFENLLRSEAIAEVQLHFSGVSVVELAYEKQVLKDQLIATAITSGVLMLLLFWTFGNLQSVIVCLLPVTLAIPATLGLMGWLGQPVTIINTVLPAIILVIGVADAVHMLTAWLETRDDGATRQAATHEMLELTGKACFFTTITTMGGFLALYSAELSSVGNFGLSVAVGILMAWLSNQILLPALLRRLDAGSRFPQGRINRLADRTITRSLQHAMSRPYRVFTATIVVVAICALLIPNLNVVQRFNEELPAEHPVSAAQQILEQDFGGFLGPEISIRRTDGSSLIDDQTLLRVERFTDALREIPDTHHVWSVADFASSRTTGVDRSALLDDIRSEPALTRRIAELINAEKNRLSVIVRIGDIGTHRANEYRARIQKLAAETMGNGYIVEIVGQWWLAQHGMRLLLSDMMTSLATALLIVLPLMWIALREPRIVAAATAANLLPLALPLAFMAATGITLRIGTAVVLAIALGIVVDNTMHIIIRMREQSNLETAMRGTGRAVVFTTLAMVAGFLSMLSNELLAIRDMGLVAAVTIAGAMLADLSLLPAAWVVLNRDRS